jgi:hypothetical protein
LRASSRLSLRGSALPARFEVPDRAQLHAAFSEVVWRPAQPTMRGAALLRTRRAHQMSTSLKFAFQWGMRVLRFRRPIPAVGGVHYGPPGTSGSHPVSAGSPDRDRDYSPLSVRARPGRVWPIRSAHTSFPVRPPERSSGIDDKNGFAQTDSPIPLVGTAPAPDGKPCLRSGLRFRRSRALLVYRRCSCHHQLSDCDCRYNETPAAAELIRFRQVSVCESSRLPLE